MDVALKHSGPGIAALIVAVLAGLWLFIMLVIAGVVESASPGGMDPDSGEAILIGLGLIASAAAGFLGLGLGLGIAGLVQPQRQRIYPIIGSILSAGLLLVCAGLMLLGLLVG